MGNKTINLRESLHIYLFDKQFENNYSAIEYSDSFIHINLDEIKTDDIIHRENYGYISGLYHIWKKDIAPYVGFTLDEHLPMISVDAIADAIKENRTAILFDPITKDNNLIKDYRNNYYDYDMRVLREIIKKKHPVMSEYAENEVLKKNKYYYPAAIIRKDIFRKFCIWLFPILDEATKFCGKKVSTIQNKYLEHLTQYAFTIYFDYYWDKLNPVNIGQFYIFQSDNKPEIPNTGTLIERSQVLIDEGRPEDIRALLDEYEKSGADSSDDDDTFDFISKILADYDRAKHHDRQCNLDIDSNIETHINRYRNSVNFISGRKPRVFLFKWNSFGNNNIINAFENAGFEVDYLEIKNIFRFDSPENYDIVNSYLDNHKFDLGFTTNYQPVVAEACYAHGIPYLSWAYDSPARCDDTYDTSHNFLFDSEDVYYNKYVLNRRNVFYLPLAVDCDYYDSLTLSKDDITKYSSEISFVGGLYQTEMNSYANYFGDYQKGMINAVTDYNIGKYGSYSIRDIAMNFTADRFGNKALFNAVYKGEKKGFNKPIEEDPTEVMKRITILMQENVTNRERLILVSMLSKHFDFKLYSNQSHELLKDVNECGTVSYEKNMPKVFKLSKINLNITLKAIISGIPLRCLDIMGNHGFLLSNYQKDFDEHFADGENLAFYHSLEEAYEKSKFYLEHESLRKKIAEKGYETVREYYNYDQAIRRMLKEADLEYMIKGNK